jgi:hypothetical protein
MATYELFVRRFNWVRLLFGMRSKNRNVQAHI